MKHVRRRGHVPRLFSGVGLRRISSTRTHVMEMRPKPSLIVPIVFLTGKEIYPIVFPVTFHHGFDTVVLDLL